MNLWLSIIALPLYEDSLSKVVISLERGTCCIIEFMIRSVYFAEGLSPLNFRQVLVEPQGVRTTVRMKSDCRVHTIYLRYSKVRSLRNRSFLSARAPVAEWTFEERPQRWDEAWGGRGMRRRTRQSKNYGWLWGSIHHEPQTRTDNTISR